MSPPLSNTDFSTSTARSHLCKLLPIYQSQSVFLGSFNYDVAEEAVSVDLLSKVVSNGLADSLDLEQIHED